MKRFHFEFYYFCWAILLFCIEVYIGSCVHDDLIRPYGGDFLVVIFVYCLLKSCISGNSIKLALTVLLLSYAIEFGQYFHLIEVLGLADSVMARDILGTTFHWIDLVAYTLGILVVLFGEIIERKLQDGRDFSG